MPRPEIAAAVAVEAGLSLVVVGSTALRLHGVPLAPHDLDVVPDPDRPDGLGAALEAWGVIRRPSLRALERDIVTVESAYGPIDLLLRRGREDFASLRRHATMADIAGVRLAIASAPECWALRRQFKGES